LDLLLVDGDDRATDMNEFTRPSWCQDQTDCGLVDHLVSPWWNQFDNGGVRVDGDVSVVAVLDESCHYEEGDTQCQERDDPDGATAAHGRRLSGGWFVGPERKFKFVGQGGWSAEWLLRSSLAP